MVLLVCEYWQFVWDRREHLFCPCLLQRLCLVVPFAAPKFLLQGQREQSFLIHLFLPATLFHGSSSSRHLFSELKAWSLFNLSQCRNHLMSLTFCPSLCLHWVLPVPFWCSIQVWADLGLIQWHRAAFLAPLGCFHTLDSVYLSSLPQGNEQMFLLSNLQRLYDLFAEW